MKCNWQDLPDKKTVFTLRSAVMKNLNTGEIIRHYSRNTRIDVVQKCVTEIGTFYRTRSAEQNNLNWAFEASAFGLPNDVAPSAPSRNVLPPKTPENKSHTISHERKSHTNSVSKNKNISDTTAPQTKDGESVGAKGGLINKVLAIFKRK